jgi:hypothetical protein
LGIRRRVGGNREASVVIKGDMSYLPSFGTIQYPDHDEPTQMTNHAALSIHTHRDTKLGKSK